MHDRILLLLPSIRFYFNKVKQGSPAAISGVRPQDIIVEFDGENVKETKQLIRRVPLECRPIQVLSSF